MGMDIFLVKYNGRNEDGSLDTEDVESSWVFKRYQARKAFLDEEKIKTNSISSEVYGDCECISRPTDFKAAYAYADTLEEWDKEYLYSVLDSLSTDKHYYIGFSF